MGSCGSRSTKQKQDAIVSYTALQEEPPGGVSNTLHHQSDLLHFPLPAPKSAAQQPLKGSPCQVCPHSSPIHRIWSILRDFSSTLVSFQVSTGKMSDNKKSTTMFSTVSLYDHGGTEDEKLLRVEVQFEHLTVFLEHHSSSEFVNILITRNITWEGVISTN